jgi:hypothetical protein
MTMADNDMMNEPSSQDTLTPEQVDELMKRRLGEQRRKHENELNQLREEMSSALANQAAQNVVSNTPELIQGEQSISNFDPDQIASRAVEAYVQRQQQEQLQRMQAEQERREEEQIAHFVNAKNEIVESIAKAAASDPEFKNLIQENVPNLSPEHLNEIESMLVSEKDPAGIFKGLLSSKDHLSAYTSEQNPIKRARLLSNIGHAVAAEKLKDMSPSDAGTFAIQSSGGSKKSTSSMSPQELREYYKKSGRY